MKSDDKKKATTVAKYANVPVDVTNPAVRCPVVLLLDSLCNEFSVKSQREPVRGGT